MRAVAWVVLLALFFNLIPVVQAQEPLQIIEVLYDLDKGVQELTVIAADGELYADPKDLAEITGYKLSESDGVYAFVRGTKTINVDVEKEEVRILGQSFSIKGAKEQDGQVWLPVSELLPWLNVNCFAEEGVLHLSIDPVSYWDVAENFNIMDYFFDISEEMGGERGALIVYFSAFLIDTILNSRVNRAVAFQGETWRDYDVYLETFRDFATDDLLVSEQALSIVKKGNKVADINGLGMLIEETFSGSDVVGDDAFSRLQEGIQEIKETTDTLNIKGLFGALKIYETSWHVQQDYHKTYEYIYEADSRRASTVREWAAHTVYQETKSTEDAAQRAVLEYIGSSMKNTAVDQGKDALSQAWQNRLVMLSGLRAMLSVTGLPDATEEISNIPVYANIQQDALDGYINYPDLSYDRENITALRLSAIMYLQAGRKCVQAKDQLMSTFGAPGLSDLTLADYDEQIALFALSAAATENDAIEDKSAKAAKLLELFTELTLTEAPLFDTGMGNTPGNLANGGIAALQDGWVYYISDVRDGNRVYKQRIDGGDKVRLSDDNAHSLNVLGDWVYYGIWAGGLYRVRTDGTDRQRLTDDQIGELVVSGEWIYYVNHNEMVYHVNEESQIYRIRTDGSGRERISGDNAASLNVADEWLYYANWSAGGSLYKMRTDGSGKVKLNNDRSNYVNVVDDLVFYSNYSDGACLYVVGTDGSGRKKLTDRHSSSVNVADGWVYFSGGYAFGETGIYRIRVNGSDRTKINDVFSGVINIIGDWIYFHNFDDGYDTVHGIDGKLYRMRTDGSKLGQVR